MAEEKEAVKTEGQTAAPPKKSSVMKYLIIIGAVIMIIVPVLAFFVASRFMKQEEKKDENRVVDTREMGVVFPMDVIVVNIANTQGTRYLRAGVSFELAGEELEAEVEKRKPQLADMIIMVLSSKELEDLYDVEGKSQIRKEILEKANDKLLTGKIKNVYFTEFVIQ